MNFLYEQKSLNNDGTGIKFSKILVKYKPSIIHNRGVFWKLKKFLVLFFLVDWNTIFTLTNAQIPSTTRRKNNNNLLRLIFFILRH